MDPAIHQTPAPRVFTLRSMLYLAMFCISVAVTSVRGECPSNAMQKAMQCTANLGMAPPTGDSRSSFNSQSDADKAVRACGNGDLFTALNCVERVKEECKNDNTDAAHFLRNMIDVDKARKSVHFFCTYAKVYAANADCIIEHHQDIDSCAHEAKTNFETQASATSNMDVLMRFQCIFFHKALKCVQEVLKDKCSSEIADIVKTSIEGFGSPNCESVVPGIKAERAGKYDIASNKEDDNNASFRVSGAVLLIIVSLLLFVL